MLLTELPRYIGYIEGYSADFGRVYFRDPSGTSLFSSRDGINIELEPPSAGLPTDIRASQLVHGLAKSDPLVPWIGDMEVEGNFDGLFINNEMVAQWRTCCSPP